MKEPKNQGAVARPQGPAGGQSPSPTTKTQEAKEYLGWLQATSKRYRQSQLKAAIAVNDEMLRFYFRLGGDIARMEAGQPWGSGFLKRLSRDLKVQMPEANCFSVNSLIYMRCFHQLYASIAFTPQVGGRFDGGEEIFPQVGGKLGAEAEMDSLVFRVPWGHHKCIIDRQSAFSSAKRRTIRWSSGRWNRRGSPSASRNTASGKFFQRKWRANCRPSGNSRRVSPPTSRWNPNALAPHWRLAADSAPAPGD